MKEKENYVLITGACGGIGRNLAKIFSEKQYPIVLVDVNENELKRVQKDLNNKNSLIIVADVSKHNQVIKVFKKANIWGGKPWVVVSSAGEGVFGKIGEFTQDNVDRVMAGNLIGTIFVSQQGFLEMKEKGGYIINILSTAANKVSEYEGIYSASKWGAKAFTESLKLTAKKTPVKVLSVYPGCINTAFWKKYNWLHPDSSAFMDPEEVAQTIVECILNKKSLWVADIVINRNY